MYTSTYTNSILTEAFKAKNGFATPTVTLPNGKCRKLYFTVLFFKSFCFRHKIPPMHLSGRN